MPLSALDSSLFQGTLESLMDGFFFILDSLTCMLSLSHFHSRPYKKTVWVHLQLPVCVFLHSCAVGTKNMVLSDENIGFFFLAHSYFFSQQEKKPHAS